MAKNSREKRFLHLRNGHTDGRTDGRTEGRKDRPSYRDARTHLKMMGGRLVGDLRCVDVINDKVLRTDRRTDGWTDPLIEMRS